MSVALLAGGGLSAQGTGPSEGSAGPPGSHLTVYLMTMGPGARVWERFGHNAIYIHDAREGTDQAYNYGLFDFQQENFLLRFIRGRMWYWMGGFPAEQHVRQYSRDNRSVWLQELAIPPEDRLELQRFLLWNERPENRFYHYDYYRDNCSTRVRDALDRALGGRLRDQTASLPSGASYRFHTQRLTASDPLVFSGLLLALGPGTDRPISMWEEMFIPMKLREHLRRVTVAGPDGAPVPVVKAERTLFESSAPPPPESPPDRTVWYLLIGAAIGGAAVALGSAAKRSRGARVALGALLWTWGAVVGVAGLVLAGLWGLTDHAMTYRNENLFQANPLAFALVVLAPMWLRGREPARRLAGGLGAVLAGLSVLGFLLQALPGLDQVNGPIVALAVPAHLGIAAALVRPR